MQYIRISKHLWDYKLYPKNYDIGKVIENAGDDDYYYGIYTYDEKHYNHWKENKNLKGIRDVKTNKIVIDFDHEDLLVAKKSTLECVSRLLMNGFNRDDIQTYFSGGKGFHIEINTNDWLERKQFENIVWGLAEDIKGFDPSVRDQQRLIRMPFTKNQNTKLYKIPLTFEEIENDPISVIKEKAKHPSRDQWDIYNDWRFKEVALPKAIIDLKNKAPEKQETEKSEITFDDRLNLARKPPWLSPTRFALQEGFFKEGERNTAFMILAATYRANGFAKELAWRMLKGVAELQAKRTGGDEYPADKLWVEVISCVFDETWRGGTYSEKETDLLQKTATRFNLDLDKQSQNRLRDIGESVVNFKDYAKNFSKNRIYTGIDTLDKNVVLATGMLVGVLGAPSSGKTTLVNNIMRNNCVSKEDVLFECLDMSENFIIARLMQTYVPYSFERICEIIENGEIDPKIEQAFEKVEKDFKGLKGNYVTSNVEDIENDIIEFQSKRGTAPKIVVVDYLEKVKGPYTDDTATSGYVAASLSDLAKKYNTCVILVLQPQKSAGDPREPLLSMRKVKGASKIEQDCRVIMTVWRPGFDPSTPENDKYTSIAVVKNNLGSTCQLDFAWDGLTGTVRDLTLEEKYQLQDLRAQIEEKKKEEQGSWPGVKKSL